MEIFYNIQTETNCGTKTVNNVETEVDAVIFENAYTAPDPGKSPQTNDPFNFSMLLALLLVVGAGLGGMTVFARRK